MKSHSFLQTVQYQQEYLAERCQLETQHHSLQKRLKAHGRTICLRPLFSQNVLVIIQYFWLKQQISCMC